MKEQSPRLTTGSSPVYPRFISGTRRALSSWLLTSGPTLFCLWEPFSCEACPRITTREETDDDGNVRVHKASTDHKGDLFTKELDRAKFDYALNMIQMN